MDHFSLTSKTSEPIKHTRDVESDIVISLPNMEELNSTIASVSTNVSFTYGDENVTASDSVGESLEVWENLRTAVFFASFTIHAISLLLNSTTLLALGRIRQELGPSLFLIVHLVIADVITSVSGLLFVVLSYELESLLKVEGSYQVLKRVQCGIYYIGYVWDTATYANLFFLLMLAVDHWIAVHKPLHYELILTRRRLCALTSVFWVVSVLLGFMAEIFVLTFDMSAAGFTYSPKVSDTYACFRMLAYVFNSHYSGEDIDRDKLILFVCSGAVIGLVLVILSYVYLSIYNVVRKLPKMVHAPVDIKSDTIKLSSNTKAIVTTLVLQATFVLGYSPYFVNKIFATFFSKAEIFPNHVAQNTFGTFAVTMVCFNSLVDPIIYAIRMRNVRRGYSRLFKRLSMFCNCKSKQANDYSYDLVKNDSSTLRSQRSTSTV